VTKYPQEFIDTVKAEYKLDGSVELFRALNDGDLVVFRMLKDGAQVTHAEKMSVIKAFEDGQEHDAKETEKVARFHMEGKMTK
jgi:hypothetical protein